MKKQWSVCQRFASCSVSPPTATHPLATSGDVVCFVPLPARELTPVCLFVIVADPLVGWSSTPSASTVMLLLPSRPPPRFLTWHLDTAMAAAAALHVLPRSLCSSVSTRVVRRSSAGSSRLPACSSRLVSFSVSSLFLPPVLLHQPPTASSTFWDISGLLLDWGLLQCCAPLQINASSGIRQRALWTHSVCVEPHAFCITALSLCVCVGDFCRIVGTAARRSVKAKGADLLWHSLQN